MEEAPEVRQDDLTRRLARTLATARLNSPPRLTHPGPCGTRARCPRCAPQVVPTLELLPTGDLQVRCCERRTLRPGDPDYTEFREVFP
jgi:hypothetical protein